MGEGERPFERWTGPVISSLGADRPGVVAAEVLRRIEAEPGVRLFLATRTDQFHRFLAVADALGRPDRLGVAVYHSDDDASTGVYLLPAPSGMAFPSYPSLHRYGLRRCSYCAMRLRWWELWGVELCRDCRPSLRSGRDTLGNVVPAGAPGPGRAFPRGSRWDAR